MVRGPIRDCAIWTRFFDLRPVVEVSFECGIRNKKCRQECDGALIA